jgi:hypothetical protein
MKHRRRRSRRYSRENPLSGQQWLLVALGAVVVGGVGYMIYTQTVEWPPSADVQQGVLSQILAANNAMGGQAPTPAQAAALASSVAALPATYAASLPAGTTPTVAGYQVWASGNVMNYIAQGGSAGGFTGAVS